MACFNAAMLEVKDINESIAMLALKWNGHLNFFLDKNFSKKYSDLLVYVGKYVQAEKSYFFCWKEGKKESGKERACEKEIHIRLEVAKPSKSSKPNHPTR